VSFYHLILVLGILGLVLLGVIFSLLTIAQRSEAQVERLAAMCEEAAWSSPEGPTKVRRLSSRKSGGVAARLI
jgi:type II secretory pathway pseudopilin PulG